MRNVSELLPCDAANITILLIVQTGHREIKVKHVY